MLNLEQRYMTLESARNLFEGIPESFFDSDALTEWEKREKNRIEDDFEKRHAKRSEKARRRSWECMQKQSITMTFDRYQRLAGHRYDPNASESIVFESFYMFDGKKTYAIARTYDVLNDRVCFYYACGSGLEKKESHDVLLVNREELWQWQKQYKPDVIS